MSFITIAGTAYDVTEITENEPEYGGNTRRTADGTLRSTIAWQKRNWTATALMTDGAYATLYSAAANGAILAIAGDSVPSINAQVQITSGGYVAQGIGFMRLVAMKVIQA